MDRVDRKKEDIKARLQLAEEEIVRVRIDIADYRRELIDELLDKPIKPNEALYDSLLMVMSHLNKAEEELRFRLEYL
jgi:hypothetical protein